MRAWVTPPRMSSGPSIPYCRRTPLSSRSLGQRLARQLNRSKNYPMTLRLRMQELSVFMGKVLQAKSAEVLYREWLPALMDAMRWAATDYQGRVELPSVSDIRLVFLATSFDRAGACSDQENIGQTLKIPPNLREKLYSIKEELRLRSIPRSSSLTQLLAPSRPVACRPRYVPWKGPAFSVDLPSASF